MKDGIAFRIASLVQSGVPTSRLGSERGQTLAEYALIIGLIAVVVIVAVTFLQTQISSLFSQLGSLI